MNREQHIRLAARVFGNSLAEQFAFINDILDHPFCELFHEKHRSILHDADTVRLIERHFGTLAAAFAALHIIADFPSQIHEIYHSLPSSVRSLLPSEQALRLLLSSFSKGSE